MRYVAIMFAVAFVLVLISLLGQMRNSMSTISELNQSSNSALQKAEQLQKDNLELELDNQELSLEMEKLKESHAELEAQIADLQQQLETAASETDKTEHQYEALQQELDSLQKEKTLLAEDLEKTVQAYDLFFELLAAIDSGECTVESVTPEYLKIESYLGDTARQTFENLSSRGE